MRAEYLIFNAVVLAGPLALSLAPFADFKARARSIVWAVCLVAVPFVAWDAAVAGRHWWFDSRYTLGFSLFGLPIEEVLFFFTVPYACVFSWETIVRGRLATPSPMRALRTTVLSVGAFACVLGIALFARGLEYTGLTLISLGIVAWLDDALGTGVLRMPRFGVFALLVIALTAVFNTYLTARPIVHYGEAYQLGLRVGTVPIEDFGYGLALMTACVSLYQWHQMRSVHPSWLARAIKRGFGGYRHQLNEVDATAPVQTPQRKRVVVIGGGLAGLSAASMLAERGFEVVLRERDSYLGGKVAGWREQLADGFDASIEHGFHAFFRHYYNLNDWLQRIGVRPNLHPVGEYTILTQDGRRLGFADKREAPILNLLTLARRRLYKLSAVATGPAGREMEAFMRYDAKHTFEAFDELPFSEFAARAQLPRDLRTMFNAFARAFFSDDDRLSTAELIKSFHFYYLSHDHGLGYDFVDGGYQDALVEPAAAFCRSHGAKIELGRPVQSLEPAPEGPENGWLVDGERCAYVVLATDVGGAGALLRASEGIRTRAPQLVRRFDRVLPGQRYAVLRVWLNVPALGPEDYPVFVSTERLGALDAVAFVDRIDPRAREWSEEHGGCVVELHCYSVPDEMPDDAVRDSLLDGMNHYFAQLAGADIEHEHMQLRRDFTAYHVGMDRHRPGVETGVRGLLLAGDWVKLPCPAMLMEAAHTSGRMAANAILAAEGLQQAPVYTVPLRGLLTKLPQRPQASGQRAV